MTVHPVAAIEAETEESVAAAVPRLVGALDLTALDADVVLRLTGR